MGVLVHHLREVELRQQLLATIGDFSAAAQYLPPLPAQTEVLGHRHGQGLHRCQTFKQLVDLKSAH